MDELVRPWSPQSPPWLVRLHDRRGDVKGAGCLLDRRRVVTCAHVVAKALGHADAPDVPPRNSVQLQFPSSESDVTCIGRVAPGGWHPAAGAGAEQPADIALLVLDDETAPPLDALPAPLGPFASQWKNIPFYAFGFPEHASGTSVEGVISGPAGPDGKGGLAGSEWAKLEGVRVAGERILPGFSGAPVWDENLSVVAGIVVAQNPDPESRVGYMIPLRTLAHYLPELVTLRRWRLRHDHEALVDHWDPEARGLPRGVGERIRSAWHFSGRAEALFRLIGHLLDDEAAASMLAVTGAPGSGKSAVLARLVTPSGPRLLGVGSRLGPGGR